MKLPIVCTDDRLRPTRSHNHDAGLDLRSAATWEVPIMPGDRVQIKTGVRVAIPAGYVGYINPRSGMAFRQGLTVLNAPGTVDAGYTGELEVNLINLGSFMETIKFGDRIAQLVIHPVELPELDYRDHLPSGQRGNNGHGSTGVK